MRHMGRHQRVLGVRAAVRRVPMTRAVPALSARPGWFARSVICFSRNQRSLDGK